MADRNKVEEYRRTLHDLAQAKNGKPAKPGKITQPHPPAHQDGDRKEQERDSAQQALEGKAAKLGLEIQGEESKTVPGTPKDRGKMEPAAGPSGKPARPATSR